MSNDNSDKYFAYFHSVLLSLSLSWCSPWNLHFFSFFFLSLHIPIFWESCHALVASAEDVYIKKHYSENPGHGTSISFTSSINKFPKTRSKTTRERSHNPTLTVALPDSEKPGWSIVSYSARHFANDKPIYFRDSYTTNPTPISQSAVKWV